MIFCFFEKLFLILDSFPSFSPSICKTFCVNSRRYNTCQENWRKCILLQVSHNYAPYRWVTSCICKHRIYTGIQSVKIYNHSYMQLASRAVSDICLKTRDLFWTQLKLLKNLKKIYPYDYNVHHKKLELRMKMNISNRLSFIVMQDNS